MNSGTSARTIGILLAVWPTLAFAQPGRQGRFEAAGIREFFTENCYQCHSATAAAAGLDLAALAEHPFAPEARPRWLRIQSRLEADEMPPAAVKLRPDPSAQARVVSWIRAETGGTPLALTLSAPARVAFGDSVPLTVTISNRSPEPASAYALPKDAALSWSIEMLIAGETSRSTTNTGGPYGSSRPAGGANAFTWRPRPLATLAPGGSIAAPAPFRLEALLSSPPFLHAGTYRIEAIYTDDPAVKPATATIEVVFEAARDLPKLKALLKSKDARVREVAGGYLEMLQRAGVR